MQRRHEKLTISKEVSSRKLIYVTKKKVLETIISRRLSTVISTVIRYLLKMSLVSNSFKGVRNGDQSTENMEANWKRLRTTPADLTVTFTDLNDFLRVTELTMRSNHTFDMKVHANIKLMQLMYSKNRTVPQSKRQEFHLKIIIQESEFWTILPRYQSIYLKRERGQLTEAAREQDELQLWDKIQTFLSLVFEK